MSAISATKARVIGSVTAVSAFLVWISNFEFPMGRMRFLVYAISHLWVELFVLLICVLSYYGRGWMKKLFVKTNDYVQLINKETNDLVRNVSLASIGLCVLIGFLWVPRIASQVDEAYEKRVRMYRFIFSGYYLSHLQLSAKKELSSGLPSAASEILKSASEWPLQSDSEKDMHKTQMMIAKSRDLLAGEFYVIFEKNKYPITNSVGGAYLAGAVLLDRGSIKYSQAIDHRARELKKFKQKAALVYTSCGKEGVQNLSKADGDSCKYFTAQSINVKTTGCVDSAVQHCKYFGYDNSVPKRTKLEHFLSVFDRTTGLTGLSSAQEMARP
ncbi:MAG: hypothetical protein JNM58_14945 [Xanthomonadaceae bacterium]|nr:hypothetical protein [Xanthomonadaceae bacterium]